MPRYFFTLVYPDQREVRDPKGTTLPSDSAAIGAARTIIEDILRGFKTRRTIESRRGQRNAPPLPTAVDRQRNGGVLHRDRQHRAEAGLRLLRERAGAALGGEPADQGRSPAHSRQHRQAGGVAAEPKPFVPKQRLRLYPHRIRLLTST